MSPRIGEKAAKEKVLLSRAENVGEFVALGRHIRIDLRYLLQPIGTVGVDID